MAAWRAIVVTHLHMTLCGGHGGLELVRFLLHGIHPLRGLDKHTCAYQKKQKTLKYMAGQSVDKTPWLGNRRPYAFHLQ